MVLETSPSAHRGPAVGFINYSLTEDKLDPREPYYSYTYSPNNEGKPQTNGRHEATKVVVNDIRDQPELTLDTAGFQHVQASTALQQEEFESFETVTDETGSEDAAKMALERYYAEIEDILRRTIPNVKSVVTYNQRTRLHEPKTGIDGYDFTAPKNYPVLRPHIDVAPETGEQLVESFVGAGQKALIINVWRPIRGVVLDAPLAVTDVRSLPKEAIIPHRVLYRDRASASYAIIHKPSIKWYFISAQTSSDVLLFKQYDSEQPEHVVAHTAFSDARFDGKEGVEPRFSIETRSVVILE
ncbi:hypothetical protein L202_07064 [Cryptococcus amylolentus CBS 6039]|uniref:Methyltransferase n=2 Tax=Cryptococcus amylolentus TaxID=104669 RepID=A0A1E3HF35_9TREE|nr:hypothetical protein L202_07064 [Cryptococcus amylolentus CBS 6039]ODN74735.1 hypothetical protein L202_07064 [Cryptococcus amylolentus CBS 6039]ODO01659.1 hypothetical protein I350_06485 [Cryptococcus amylolentus CBS 6273]